MNPLLLRNKSAVGDPLTESVSVLDIGVSELLDPHVNENSVVQCSETHSEAARTPLSATRSNNESLHDSSIVGLETDSLSRSFGFPLCALRVAL